MTSDVLDTNDREKSENPFPAEIDDESPVGLVRSHEHEEEEVN